MKIKGFFAIALLAVAGFFFCAGSVAAFEKKDLTIKIYDRNLKLVSEFGFLPETFNGETDLAIGDVDGDSEGEVIVSLSDRENDSKILIYEKNGQLVREFRPFVEGYNGPIYLAAADLDNNKLDEIIVGAGSGGGPQIRILDQEGHPKFINDFWAEDKDNYRNGVRVGAGDINQDGLIEIITSTFTDKARFQFFNRYGQKVQEDIEQDIDNLYEPPVAVSTDLGNDGVNELVTNYGYGFAPELNVLRNDGSKINSFMAYDPGFGGGVEMVSIKDGERTTFVTAAGLSGGPHVRFLDNFGNPVKDLRFFVYPDDYKGGVNVAVDQESKDINYVFAPKLIWDESSNVLPKRIEVDVSKQKMYIYEYNRLVKEFWVSTGTWQHPTPLGVFSVFKKRESVHMQWFYGPGSPDNYDLPGVPYVLSFNGPYTIHGTYWHHNFGHRMSHGCVNMYTPEANWVYNWAPMGTPVIVYNGNRDAVLK
ncbi:MAG TPA: L,D-transpeptidase [Candidatus Bipolaricaulota bacterium]|nr:L,D-transpeptidase [Candidatus Bipolaricaulota bacterium]